MKYNIERLLQEEKQHKLLFFWGHRPNADGSISKTCMSQWWLSSFVFENIIYKTAEHWMMAKKAELFDDVEVLQRILVAKSPAEAKKLGREVRGYNEAIWREKRFEVVKQGNLLKFGQNEELKTYLINTGSRVLVEASPEDPVWGIGMPSDHRDASSPEKWKGQNLLGFALMEVRDELISER